MCEMEERISGMKVTIEERLGQRKKMQNLNSSWHETAKKFGTLLKEQT